MKPRNATERKLVRYAAALPPLTARQTQYAYDNSFVSYALFRRRGRKVKCMCCGNETVWEKPFLESFIDVDEYDCPQCGSSMPMKEWLRDTPMTDRRFFTVITTFRGIQLARTFDVTRDNSRTAGTRYGIEEIFQNWILDDGTETITSRPYHRSAFTLGFNTGAPYEIKRHNASTTGYYQMDDLFDICGSLLYPRVRVTPLVKRNGWRTELTNYRNSIAMTDAIMWLLKNPTAEMLVKTGQLDLFRHMVRENLSELPFLHAVRIANRRKYIVRDSSLWLDMLRMADRTGLDTHNPSVVCPADLVEAHDRILRRFARRQRLEEAKSDLEKAKNAEALYRKDKGKYFGIRLEEKDLTVTVIPTVREILQEGEKMHHCVFRMKYYTRQNSLLLSARDGNGKRLETVELSLKTFKVLQSRGVLNSNSPRHDQIISLVERNAPLFRMRSAN